MFEPPNDSVSTYNSTRIHSITKTDPYEVVLCSMYAVYSTCTQHIYIPNAPIAQRALSSVRENCFTLSGSRARECLFQTIGWNPVRPVVLYDSAMKRSELQNVPRMYNSVESPTA